MSSNILPYEGGDLYKKYVFMEAKRSQLLDSISEWMKEEVEIKVNKKKTTTFREYFVVDLLMFFDGDYHIATVYCTKDMPK